MYEKRKLESDKKLIQILFNTEPLDWNRRDDGTLVFLYPDGRKQLVTPEDLAAMTDKKLAGAAAPKLAQPAGAPPAGVAKATAPAKKSTSKKPVKSITYPQKDKGE